MRQLCYGAPLGYLTERIYESFIDIKFNFCYVMTYKIKLNIVMAALQFNSFSFISVA